MKPRWMRGDWDASPGSRHMPLEEATAASAPQREAMARARVRKRVLRARARGIDLCIRCEREREAHEDRTNEAAEAGFKARACAAFVALEAP